MFDTYSLKARVLPVYLTLAPVFLLLAAIMPDGLKLPLGTAAAVSFMPISFLFSQIGADFGKRQEKRLWREWDGQPTTRFLRHDNKEFNEVTRHRIHEKLRSIGLTVPTREEQQQDKHAADKHYESCIEELIRRTRNKKKYPLVFKGLVDYGFRRNLFGLKYLGITLTLTSLVGASWSTYASWSLDNPPAVAIVTDLITLGLLIMWITWVTDRTVKLAANRYARFVLEAAMDQE